MVHEHGVPVNFRHPVTSSHQTVFFRKPELLGAARSAGYAVWGPLVPTGTDFTGLVQLVKQVCVIFISHQIWELFSCVRSAHRPHCCGSTEGALRAQMLKAWSSACSGLGGARAFRRWSLGGISRSSGGTWRGFWDLDLFLSLFASGSSKQPAPSWAPIMVISLSLSF